MIKLAHSEPTYKMGDFPPEGLKPEISGNLILDHQATLEKKSLHEIFGDGHSHEVLLSDVAWKRIQQNGEVIVRTGPGGNNFHSHWIVAKIAAPF